jgi:hypothetical protein
VFFDDHGWEHYGNRRTFPCYSPKVDTLDADKHWLEELTPLLFLGGRFYLGHHCYIKLEVEMLDELSNLM